MSEFAAYLDSRFEAIDNMLHKGHLELQTIKSSLIAVDTEPEKTVYSIPDAAKYLSIAEITLRKKLADNVIPYSQLIKGGKITIAKADLDNYLNATRRKSKAEISELLKGAL